MRSLKSALRLAGMGSALLDAAVFVSFCRPRLSVPCTTCISPASKSMSRTSRPTISPRLMPDPTAARSANSMGFLGSRESTSALMPSTGGGGVRCSVSMAGGSAYSHGLESASPPFTASRNILWSVTDMSRT